MANASRKTASAKKTVGVPKVDGPSARASPSPALETIPALPTLLLQEQIAQRAYQMFEQDGFQHGRDLQHWLAAESELTGS
jgi:Protein of unknown function (DUF2934)